MRSRYDRRRAARRSRMCVGNWGDQRREVLRLEEELREPGCDGAAGTAAVARKNAKLKRLMADLALDKHIPGEIVRKRSEAGTQAAAGAAGAAGAGWLWHESEPRVLATTDLPDPVGYRSGRPSQEPLRRRMRELAQGRPRHGYRRVHVLLRREGWRVNLKRIRRLYRLEGLPLWHRVRRRKHASLHRGIPPAASRAHARWSMDFVHDALMDGTGIPRADGGRSVESLASDPDGTTGGNTLVPVASTAFDTPDRSSC